VLAALLIGFGLAVDGARMAHDHRQAEVWAAQLARAGTDAVAGLSAEHDGALLAQRAAQAVADAAARRGIGGVSTAYDGGALHVTVSVSTKTVFLTLIGVHTLDSVGAAGAQLRP
jgi:hypothetical protein